MLGFGPIATLPVAGSPLGASIGYTLVAGAGLYYVSGGAAGLFKTSILYAGPGQYEVSGFGAQLGPHRVLNAGAGSYLVRGYSARMYPLTFFYGDVEVIKVTPEVTYMRVLWEPEDPETIELVVAGEAKTMHIPSEHRDIVIAAKDNAPIAESDQDGSLEPRLRRT